MKATSFEAMRGTARRAIIALAIALLALACLVPTALATATAEEDDDSTAIAKSSDGKTYYYSIPMAWEAATGGTKIVMLKDWQLNTALTLPEGKTATIEMNGHMIYQNLAELENGRRFFVLEDNSTLNILGENAPNTSFTFYEYASYAYGGKPQKKTVVSGGLLTAGRTPYYEENDGGGITMYEGSKLRLEGVTIGGCRAEDGGAIDVDDTDCEISLVNSTLDGNVARQGGAIYINEDRCTINMSGSTISNNCSDSEGGAVYSNDYFTKIYMTKKSSFVGNKSLSLYSGDNGRGGAIFFFYPDYTVESSDGTGLFEGNVAATQGGAIYVDQSSFTQNEGHITGITFKSNVATGEECVTSSSNGGAIYVGQEYLFIKDCTFTGNKAEFGAAVSIFNDYCNISDTVMTNNSALTQGGAVYIRNTCDVTLGGKVIVKDNYRVSNTGELLNRDDIYLPKGGGDEATVLGTPSSGSLVGLRSSEEASNILVGEKQTAEISGIFFSDYEGYKIEYKSRKLYQVKGDEYTVMVNGETIGVYAKGADVIVDGTSTDPDKTFKTWDGGMVGIDLGHNKNSAVAAFSMPANSVKLTAKYIDRIKSVTLTVEQPEAGEELAEEGEVTVTYINGKTKTVEEVPIVWAEGEGDDAQTVSGKAGYSKSYYAIASVERNVSNDIIFSQALEEKEVHVTYDGVEGENLGGYEVIDSGDLIIYGKALTTEKPTVTSVNDINLTVTVDTTDPTKLDAAYKAQLPKAATAKLNSGETVELKYESDGVPYDVSTVLNNGNLKNGEFDVKYLVSSDDVTVPQNTSVSVHATLYVNAQSVLPPTFTTAAGTYGGVSKKIELACATEGATIKYIIDSDDIKTYNAADGITLEGTKGSKTTHTVTAWGIKDGCYASSVAEATYVLDNPFTVTVYGEDTGTKTNKDLWTPAKTYSYYKDDKVTIVCPVVENEQFEKWKGISGATVADADLVKNAIVIEKLEDDVSLTAVYNPVIKSISLNITDPEAGERLAETVSAATVTVAGSTVDIKDYFEDITWVPSDETADYNTGYTAKLAMKDEAYTADMKLIISHDAAITANSGEEGVTARVAKESAEQGDKYYLYVMFPKTEKVKFVEAQATEPKTLTRAEVAESGWADKLPRYVTVLLSDGSQALADVEWTDVPEFDLKNDKAQTVTATGFISALPDYADYPDGTETVEVSVEVKIPAKEKTPTVGPTTDDGSGLAAMAFAACVSAAMLALLAQRRKNWQGR